MTIDSAVFGMESLIRDRARGKTPYLEFLRVTSMSAGLYELPAGGNDRQTPHGTDELYYVLEGKASFSVDGDIRPVEPGSVIFVRAGVEHRFERIEERLRLLVVFSPPEP